MQDYWPTFPLIVGLAFVATWAAGRCRATGLLVPAAVGLLVGGVGFSFTLDWLGGWVIPVIENGPPLVLVVMGLLMVFRGIVSGLKPDQLGQDDTGGSPRT